MAFGLRRGGPGGKMKGLAPTPTPRDAVMARRTVLLLLPLLAAAVLHVAQPPAAGQAQPRELVFEEHVLPILKAKCLNCHGDARRRQANGKHKEIDAAMKWANQLEFPCRSRWIDVELSGTSMGAGCARRQ